jgi:hypothetical protein
MKYATKTEFLEMALQQAKEKQANADRRRRLDGRLEEMTLNQFADLLPSKVAYNITSKGLIKADWVDLNIKVKNLHIFNNNTIGITDYDERPFRVIVVIKATYQNVLRVKTTDILGKRLTLNELQEMEANGLAKPYNKVKEALGL